MSEVGITIPHPQERASDIEPRLLPSLGPRKLHNHLDANEKLKIAASADIWP